jgi:hypothetical protein
MVLEQWLQVLQQNGLLEADGRRQQRGKQQLSFGDQGEI